MSEEGEKDDGKFEKLLGILVMVIGAQVSLSNPNGVISLLNIDVVSLLNISFLTNFQIGIIIILIGFGIFRISVGTTNQSSHKTKNDDDNNSYITYNDNPKDNSKTSGFKTFSSLSTSITTYMIIHTIMVLFVVFFEYITLYEILIWFSIHSIVGVIMFVIYSSKNNFKDISEILIVLNCFVMTGLFLIIETVLYRCVNFRQNTSLRDE